MFVIGQVKSDILDLKQPIKAYIRAVNNQSRSSILLLTQLYTQLIMLSIDFEQNFSVFHSIGHIDLLTTAAQMQEFCHLF